MAPFDTYNHCALQKYIYKIYNLKLHTHTHTPPPTHTHTKQNITKKKKKKNKKENISSVKSYEKNGVWGCVWKHQLWVIKGYVVVAGSRNGPDVKNSKVTSPTLAWNISPWFVVVVVVVVVFFIFDKHNKDLFFFQFIGKMGKPGVYVLLDLSTLMHFLDLIMVILASHYRFLVAKQRSRYFKNKKKKKNKIK